MTTLAKRAVLIQELVDYDGPQLMLLKTNRNRHMIATAVRRDGMEEPFFGCEIPDKVYDQYFNGTADLHFAFARAIGEKYYFFDLSDLQDDSVKLQKAEQGDAADPAYWPQIGFFSRSHTNPFNKVEKFGATKTFKIDGKWEANDFSHFHGKMSDLYALFGVLDRLDGANSQIEKGFIRQMIHERFWKGGGSYVGFYDSLMARNRELKLNPLEVDKIRYASPGEIALRGDEKVLANISDIVDVFDEKWVKLAADYRNIHGSLSKAAMLSAGPSMKFASPAARSAVRKLTREFAETMRIEKAEQIYEACDRNVLVYAKVVLSIYRRANEMYVFYAEGRVQRV